MNKPDLFRAITGNDDIEVMFDCLNLTIAAYMTAEENNNFADMIKLLETRAKVSIGLVYMLSDIGVPAIVAIRTVARQMKIARLSKATDIEDFVQAADLYQCRIENDLLGPTDEDIALDELLTDLYPIGTPDRTFWR